MTKPAQGSHRRLAAIFCADVAGYTRLMNMDERGTLRLLASHREITDREIERHRGRVANTAGDSILAEFSSTVDALQCAVTIQERIASLNETVPKERRVTFRIGVHVGEVMIRGGDLFGDGVNIAARLEKLAEPGAVCLSGAAYDYAHRALPFVFEDIGPQAVKNLDTSLRAYLLRASRTRSSRVFPFDHRQFEIYWVRQLYSVCMAAMDEIARTADLKGVDIPVLAGIMDEPDLGFHQLSERIGIRRSTVQRSAARLERKGLITCAPIAGKSGARRLNPTAEGMQLRLALRSEVIVAQDRMMVPLSDQERAMLKDFIQRVVETNLGRKAR